MALASMDVFPYHTHLIAQVESHMCKSTQNWTPLKKKQETRGFPRNSTQLLLLSASHTTSHLSKTAGKRKPHGSMKQWHHECKLWIPEAPCSFKGTRLDVAMVQKHSKTHFRGKFLHSQSKSRYQYYMTTIWSPIMSHHEVHETGQKISWCAILQHRNSKFQTNQCHSIVKQKVLYPCSRLLKIAMINTQVPQLVS